MLDWAASDMMAVVICFEWVSLEVGIERGGREFKGCGCREVEWRADGLIGQCDVES